MGFESIKLVLRVQQFSLFIAFLLTNKFSFLPKNKVFKKGKIVPPEQKKEFFCLVQFFCIKTSFLILIFSGRHRAKKRKKIKTKVENTEFFFKKN